MVRARLRLIGRFLIEIKKIQPKIKNVRQVFDLQYYNDAIKAVHVIAQINPKTKVYECPSILVWEHSSKLLVNDLLLSIYTFVIL